MNLYVKFKEDVLDGNETKVEEFFKTSNKEYIKWLENFIYNNNEELD